MITYNKVELEGNTLTINFSVEEELTSAVKIIGFRIDNGNSYGTDTALETIESVPSNNISHSTVVPNPSTNIFVITPQVTITSDLPCGKDIVDKKIIYNRDLLYNKGLRYIKDLGDTCNISKEFIDFILKKEAFEYAVKTCNVDKAVKYWNLLTGVHQIIVKSCGCHGKTI